MALALLLLLHENARSQSFGVAGASDDEPAELHPSRERQGLRAVRHFRRPAGGTLLFSREASPISTVIDLPNFLCQTLRERDYAVQNFILTPQQFGIPNARVRFYCLVRGTHQTAALRCALTHGRSIQLATPTTNQATLRSSAVSAGPDQAHRIMETIPSTAAGGGTHARTIADYLTPLEDGGDDQYLVPPSFLKSLTRGYRFGTHLPSGKASSVLIVDLCVSSTDIVTPADEESTCFTKNYAKNFKGSGPLFLPECTPSPSKVLLTRHAKRLVRISLIAWRLTSLHRAGADRCLRRGDSPTTQASFLHSPYELSLSPSASAAAPLHVAFDPTHPLTRPETRHGQERSRTCCAFPPTSPSRRA